MARRRDGLARAHPAGWKVPGRQVGLTLAVLPRARRCQPPTQEVLRRHGPRPQELDALRREPPLDEGRATGTRPGRPPQAGAGARRTQRDHSPVGVHADMADELSVGLSDELPLKGATNTAIPTTPAAMRWFRRLRSRRRPRSSNDARVNQLVPSRRERAFADQPSMVSLDSLSAERGLEVECRTVDPLMPRSCPASSAE